MNCKTVLLKDLVLGEKGSYGIGAPAVDYNPKKYTYLRITDINDDGSINTNGLKSVDAEDAYKYVLQENDIVFARTGASTGKTYFYQPQDGTLVYAGFLIKFSIDPRKVNPRLLKYITHSQEYYNWVRSFDTGGTRGNINAVTFANMPITLPNRATQDKIVAILSSLDDKIELNRRINVNLEQQAQALFDEIMSCELEYDLIANIPHVIETGKRPKGGVASITSGIPSIGAENIKGLGYYDYSKTKYITEEFATTLKKGFVNGYELLIYKDGGKPGYFIPNFSIFGNGFPYNQMALNEHVFLLDFRNKGYNFFAYFYFQQEKIMRYLNAQGSKAAIPGINRNDIENISIPTIQNKVIQDFCRQTENIITHILNNASESRKLSIVRDALLPKLISGKIKI